MRTKLATAAAISFLLMAAAPLIGVAAETSSDMRGKLSEKDYKFVKEAAEGGMMEVELGKVATQKTSSDDVKSFGQQMVADHEQANEKLKAIAASKGAVLPSDLTPRQRKEIQGIEQKSGSDFDKDYVKHMVKDHKKDVRDFRHASETLDDPDLRSFATSTLPTLEQHLEHAEHVESSIK